MMVPPRKVFLSLVAPCLLLGAPAHAADMVLPAVQDAGPSQEARGRLTLVLPSVEEAQQADAFRSAEAPEAAEAQAAAEAEAVRVREANAGQLAAAQADARRIAADKQAEEERLAQFREEQRVHEEAVTAYAAQIAAAEAARDRWKGDVAACKAGDRTRCGVAGSAQ
jgi:pyruvate/2-oxoglutarate dehydrogenase complex dihydrolipoamide acyltransferase (E2) component